MQGLFEEWCMIVFILKGLLQGMYMYLRINQDIVMHAIPYGSQNVHKKNKNNHFVFQ